MSMLNHDIADTRVEVLGCPITKLDLEDFVVWAEQFISSRKPHYIAVVNVAKIVKMRSDKDLKESVLGADMIGADGVPVVWASRLLGNPLPGRVNGTDLMYRLLERANEIEANGAYKRPQMIDPVSMIFSHVLRRCWVCSCLDW